MARRQPGAIASVVTRPLPAQLDKAGVPATTTDAIVAENADARIDGLRSALSLLAVVALIALYATRRIPARQPSAMPVGEPATSGDRTVSGDAADREAVHTPRPR